MHFIHYKHIGHRQLFVCVFLISGCCKASLSHKKHVSSLCAAHASVEVKPTAVRALVAFIREHLADPTLKFELCK